jgi:hypothetical protein
MDRTMPDRWYVCSVLHAGICRPGGEWIVGDSMFDVYGIGSALPSFLSRTFIDALRYES